MKRSIDHSRKISGLDFTYDDEFYPNDDELADPQEDPILVGARVPIQKVGIGPVDLPVVLARRNGGSQVLHAKASLYGSLDNPNAKGLNLSRFYLLMHEKIADRLSMKGLKDILREMTLSQNCAHAYCKLRFSYPWYQEALRTREEISEDDLPFERDWYLENEDSQVFKVVKDKVLSHDKKKGHIFYDCELEGQVHNGEYKFYLTVDYYYSSTCPCSFELSQDATRRRGKAANAHSQRSIAKIKVQFNPDNPVWIEDVVELAREYVPTEVQVVVKRRDEQAFAELNGTNLIFTEDAARLLYEGLDQWYATGVIEDFCIVTQHFESLHPWDAIAVLYKEVDGGLT